MAIFVVIFCEPCNGSLNEAVRKKTLTMKTLTILRACLPAMLFAVLFAGCHKKNSGVTTRTVQVAHPVYVMRSEVLQHIKNNEPRDLRSPGKIYLFGSYLFVNELYEGVHIFDNSNPKSPRPISFINIPGNVDIAVKGHTLYADMFADLLAIDISDPIHISITERVVNVFPEKNYWIGLGDDSALIAVDWILKDTVVESYDNVQLDYSLGAFASKSNSSASGRGGSMARFTIVNSYLYTVSTTSLGVFDIAAPAHPVNKVTVGVGMNIETIYPFSNRLFIGSATGMFIFNIDDPASPFKMSSFEHARSCDPVVADGNYAYVTLRSGVMCAGNVNQLDVINVSDLFNPSLVRTYPLSNPNGLAKDGNLLFVCDGAEGLKVFNAENPAELRLVRQIKGQNTYDAIAWNDVLLVVGSEGIVQYDYSNPWLMKQLSRIKTADKDMLTFFL